VLEVPVFWTMNGVYQPVNPDAQSLKVRLHGPGLYAELRLAL